METIADTNFLLRFILRDDENQFRAAARRLKSSDIIIIATHVFCEIAWALSYSYNFRRHEVLKELEALTLVDKVKFQKDEVEAGLAFLRRGGDFADGVIAYTGRKMASAHAEFVSFDRKAVRLLNEQGIPALMPE